jgi:dienelactone hydrolase
LSVVRQMRAECGGQVARDARFHVKQCAAALILSMAGVAWGTGKDVRFPGEGVELAGRLYVPSDASGRFPAIVMLHGCSGMWGQDGEPTASYDFWAEHFRARGHVVVLVDSFGPRGEKEICTQSQRKVTSTADRPREAYSALRWLAARDDVDAGRVHVLGWSNGGTTVLNALRADAPGRSGTGPTFRSGVALYPGCALLAKAPYRPVAPLLIQAGDADDWTPARHCTALAKQADAGMIEIDVYPGAHHSFDRIGGRVRERPDVRNPNRPGGRGATVGPNPEARAKAIERVTGWIRERGR